MSPVKGNSQVDRLKPKRTFAGIDGDIASARIMPYRELRSI
jgi:hypothetical protein